jgi:hypothetical protein
MRGQASVELLVLVGAILISVASMLYLGAGSNELTLVLRAARDGVENAALALALDYGCSVKIRELGFSAGVITIEVAVRNAPPSGQTWENFAENIVEPTVRAHVLRFIAYALTGAPPAEPYPVRTSYYTYDVEVAAERVTR